MNIKPNEKLNNKIENRTSFFYYAFRNILLISLPLVLVSALILSLPHSSAHSSNTDSLSLTLPTSCTLSANVTSAHTIEMVSGQYADNIGNTRMNAYCNDNNGYYIYALGVSNDIDGNTDLVSNVGSNYNIHTGIYSSEGLTPTTPSSWAMKLTAGTGTNASTTVPVVINAFTSYQNIPSSSTVVAYRTSNTDMTTNTDLTGSYIDATYEIYTSPTQPAGNYLGKVKYTMVHPYDSSKLTSIEDAFDIAGKDKITVTDPATGDAIGSYYKMQDMTTNICNLVSLYNEPSQTQLVDIRDNKLYWVAKLDDEHCWMTQNLELDIIADTTAQNYVALDSTNTDIDVDSYNPNGGAYSPDGGYSKDSNTGIVTWIPQNTTISTGNLSLSTWVDSNTMPSSYNSGDIYYYSSGSSANDYSYTLIQCETQSHTDCDHYKAGNYYNWSAAVASNDTSILTNADNSICPKGWRLPKTLHHNDFNTLGTAYDITNNATALNLRNEPLYFVRSGRISNGELNNAGNYCGYWSDASYLGFDPGNYTTSGVYHGKNSGFSVRCLTR